MLNRKIYNPKQGFTLMEIVIVIIIIGVMAGMAIPNYLASVERSRSAEGVQILISFLGAQKRFFLANDGVYSNNLAALDIQPMTSNNFDLPTASDGTGLGLVIATIVRTGGAYTLNINPQGTITCAGQANICSQWP